jgi:hypothetical protein
MRPIWSDGLTQLSTTSKTALLPIGKLPPDASCLAEISYWRQIALRMLKN